MFKFGKVSKQRLEQIHPDLKVIMEELIQVLDVSIICGYRGKIEQNEAEKAGKSTKKFPESKHNQTPSLAVDVVPYPISWSDTERFARMVGIIQGIAHEKDIKIRCGMDFSFHDYPHIELI